MLTSLPIVFGEQFALDTPASPLLSALEGQYKVVAVDGPEPLPRRGLLLAIQPQALTAERLVALDRWVRGGGRLVLLADPKLEWESARPLGDRFRPPFVFPDVALLRHWGLALEDADSAGVQQRTVGASPVEAQSSGRLIATGRACSVAKDGFVATCRIGRGRAIVVADADWVMDGTADPNPAHRALIGLLATP